MMLSFQSLSIVVSLVLLLLLLEHKRCEAFQVPTPAAPTTTRRTRGYGYQTQTTTTSSPTQLSAWTVLPTPALPFRSWYKEYNPTARKIVYDDSPLDLGFLALGEDWPSVDLETMFSEENESTACASSLPTIQVRRGPMRRVAEWAGRVRRHAE